jgi:hypothetical protein
VNAVGRETSRERKRQVGNDATPDGGVSIEDLLLAAEHMIDRLDVTPEQREAFLRHFRDQLAVAFEHMPDEERPTPKQVAEYVRRHFRV